MIILIAVAALSLIIGVWGIALFDSNPSLVNTTLATTPYETEPPETVISSDTSTIAPEETTTEDTEKEPFVKPTGKYIALTFDDGPNAAYTAQILDILEKYNAKATFFVNGYNLSSSRANLLKRAVSMGCEIGNHTENHKNLKELTAEELYEEIQSVNERIYDLCGYEVTLLRPPGGNTNLSVMQRMYDMGFRMPTIMWNNDSRDWEYNSQYRKGTLTREEAIRLTYDEMMKWPFDGAILLMHDIWEITPDVLERLLQKLSQEGYQFITISEMFDFESMGDEAYFSKFYADGKYLNLLDHQDMIN